VQACVNALLRPFSEDLSFSRVTMLLIGVEIRDQQSGSLRGQDEKEFTTFGKTPIATSALLQIGLSKGTRR
jgi:hypothetical protein